MASYERIPYLILFQESAGYKDTYAGPMDQAEAKRTCSNLKTSLPTRL